MSLDLKVYLTSKLDLDDKETEFEFIDYVNVSYTGDNTMDTYYSITQNDKAIIFPEDWDDTRTFDSYVFNREYFESDSIINSEVKEEILNNDKYKNSKFKYVCIQPF